LEEKYTNAQKVLLKRHKHFFNQLPLSKPNLTDWGTAVLTIFVGLFCGEAELDPWVLADFPG
jgi:hypothetical protein